MNVHSRSLRQFKAILNGCSLLKHAVTGLSRLLKKEKGEFNLQRISNRCLFNFYSDVDVIAKAALGRFMRGLFVTTIYKLTDKT